jgi:hypothetical protein
VSIQQLLASYGAAGGGGGDPDFSSVVSLLHFDGTNGSTTFTDQIGAAWTVNTGPTISTAESKFGGASGSFGSGSIQKNGGTSYAFGTGDFTLEMWLRRNTGSGVIFDDRVGSFGAGMALYIPNATDDLIFFANGGNQITATPYSTGTFRHVAICRASGTTRLFIDGVSAGTYSDTNDYQANTWVLGAAFNNTAQQSCYIDDFRATNGVARYTSNFTPPTAPFPDS